MFNTEVFTVLYGSEIISTWTMVALDILMIVYTWWVFSLSKPKNKVAGVVGIAMLAWLAILYWGFSTESVFPPDISGIAFLAIIFMFVGVVGAILFAFPQVRRLILELDQRQLLLLQGIRVFFGATFLMQGGLGILPLGFGILDGFTHIGAGFFGLVAAFSLATGIDGTRRAWFANAFGLADILIVASSLALILLPDIGPHHSMMYAVFLAAPFWLWFHLISIWKLIRDKSIAPEVHRS